MTKKQQVWDFAMRGYRLEGLRNVKLGWESSEKWWELSQEGPWELGEGD